VEQPFIGGVPVFTSQTLRDTGPFIFGVTVEITDQLLAADSFRIFTQTAGLVSIVWPRHETVDLIDECACSTTYTSYSLSPIDNQPRRNN